MITLRHRVQHELAPPRTRTVTTRPSLIDLWLDDRRALPLKWGLLALLLLGLALLEVPL